VPASLLKEQGVINMDDAMRNVSSWMTPCATSAAFNP